MQFRLSCDKKISSTGRPFSKDKFSASSACFSACAKTTRKSTVPGSGRTNSIPARSRRLSQLGCRNAHIKSQAPMESALRTTKGRRGPCADKDTLRSILSGFPAMVINSFSRARVNATYNTRSSSLKLARSFSSRSASPYPAAHRQSPSADAGRFSRADPAC